MGDLLFKNLCEAFATCNEVEFTFNGCTFMFMREPSLVSIWKGVGKDAYCCFSHPADNDSDPNAIAAEIMRSPILDGGRSIADEQSNIIIVFVT